MSVELDTSAETIIPSSNQQNTVTTISSKHMKNLDTKNEKVEEEDIPEVSKVVGFSYESGQIMLLFQSIPNSQESDEIDKV